MHQSMGIVQAIPWYRLGSLDTSDSLLYLIHCIQACWNHIQKAGIVLIGTSSEFRSAAFVDFA
jgi:hypothetical protein